MLNKLRHKHTPSRALAHLALLPLLLSLLLLLLLLLLPLLLLLLRQADAEWRRHEPSVRNIRQVVRITDKAVRERWKKYDELFDHVSSTVSNKFMAYMHRRGHAVRNNALTNQGPYSNLTNVGRCEVHGVHAQEGARGEAAGWLSCLICCYPGWCLSSCSARIGAIYNHQ
jgi:DNA-binding helix-hairpin-helix protein with protein kinase domain